MRRKTCQPCNLFSRAKSAMFRTLADVHGNLYFSIDKQAFNLSHEINVSVPTGLRQTKFFSGALSVPKHNGGWFSADLTERDDLLLAFLSLLLLLVVDGLVGTILLRTRDGNVNTFGFSVKHVIDLLRDFEVRDRRAEQRPRTDRQKKFDRKIASVAVLVLLLTLGFEVLILFLTSPEYKMVTNKSVSFRIRQPFIPAWASVFYHARTSINQPCTSVALSGVNQGRTVISPCVKSSADGAPLELFEEVNEVVNGAIDVELISDYHRYGSEHYITFDNATTSFSTRAYFTLNDGKMRIMKAMQRQGPKGEKELAELAHKQFIAFVFTAYSKVVPDGEMNLERLNSLKFRFSAIGGPRTEILRTNGKRYHSKSRRYITKLRGILPRGSPVLLFGQQFFRGAAAVDISEPDQDDLFIATGKHSAHAVVWLESVRAVNWLSLTIILVISTLTLLILRSWARSVSTSEIAGLLVKQEVHANVFRSPVELDRREKSFFRVTSTDDDYREYQYGAETYYSWDVSAQDTIEY